MQSLSEGFSDDFTKCWVLQKAKHALSCTPLDQGHEQNHEVVKGSGGVVGITENLNALDISSENVLLVATASTIHVNPRKFNEASAGPAETISTLGNPFLGDCPELLALDTRNCASEGTVMRKIKDLGWCVSIQLLSLWREVSVHQTKMFYYFLKGLTKKMYKR